ncbi:CAP domain-containing protein [Alkanindiges sp. WGS2144]|uniref:CAP domain-containing protein n=1 Tax=Alkanindiges sp. WGS2144 TaxID=3366808 RepID=UPI0037501199
MKELMHVKTILSIMTISFLCSGCGGSSGSDDYQGSTSNHNNPEGNTPPVETTPGETPLSLCGENTSIQQLLDKVNAIRSKARYCGEAHYPATAKLTWNKNLAKAAQAHSDDMAVNNYFSHTGLDGSNIGDRALAAGYNYRYTGENIAAGQESIDEVMEAWLKSPGHCANMMSVDFKEYGMACASNSQSKYKTYWTQEFGTRQ